MVRCRLHLLECPRSFPHSRGDGPRRSSELRPDFMFSPLAWGWSANTALRMSASRVFPTRVGMVRQFPLCRIHLRCFPHSRGDGPIESQFGSETWAFSPLAWGWSGCPLRSRIHSGVFPTRVGMVRQCARELLRTSSFPHSRGDGPATSTAPNPTLKFSPLAWGWSVCGSWGDQQAGVFPTRVGMVRSNPSLDRRPGRFPHSRGDGPQLGTFEKVKWAFSPLAWGWSAHSLRRPALNLVFPTRVGMVRGRGRCRSYRIRFPHSRGDGPFRERFFRSGCLFSPLAWGWSGK